jgi:hypothetical protein
MFNPIYIRNTIGSLARLRTRSWLACYRNIQKTKKQEITKDRLTWASEFIKAVRRYALATMPNELSSCSQDRYYFFNIR